VSSWYSCNRFIGTGRGKNALKFAYLRKAILFLESEIELLKLTFRHTSRFSDNQPSDNSKVYFVPKSGGLCIDGMGEFALSFELSRQFLDAQGHPAPLILISQALEQAFHFSFGDIYKSKARIFKRKPYNLTKALDCLKNLIVRAGRKQDEKG
jgi:hypothetical protein